MEPLNISEEMINNNIYILDNVLTVNEIMGKAMRDNIEMCRSVQNIVKQNNAIITEIAQMASVNPLNESIRRMTDIIQNTLSPSLVVKNNWEQCNKIVQSFVKEIQFSFPKISVPNIPEDTRNRIRFINIARKIEFPIFLECDTELQDMILASCDDADSDEDFPINEIKECIYTYYNHDMLYDILESWRGESWINEKRKDGLKEAIDLYVEGRYYGCTSILMCQIGGIINELYSVSNIENRLSTEERNEIITNYNIGKRNSEKAKLVQMLASQSKGIVQWYCSSKYFMDYTYSSSKDEAHFINQPGRNKICHGEQVDYGTKEYALKAILAVDIIIQLGIQMINENSIPA